jgi:predicted  nucleic acid-binding Zn-ribbon protein
VIKNILKFPHKAEEDVICYDLFRCCLIGEDQQLYHIVTLLRQMGDFSNSKLNKNFQPTILEIMTKMKCNVNDSVSSSMYTSLNSIENDIYEISKHGLQNDSNHSKRLVDLNSQKINNLIKNFKIKNLDEMDKIFATFEINFKGNKMSDLAKLEDEKIKNWNKYEQGISILSQQIETVAQQENDLNSILSQLEDKIKQVKKEINDKRELHARLENDKRDLSKQWNNFKEFYVSNRDKVKSSEFQVEDFELYQKVSEFVTTSKRTIYESLNKLQVNVDTMFNKSSNNYLEQVELHMKNLNSDLVNVTKELEKLGIEILAAIREYLKGNRLDLKESIFKLYEQFEKLSRTGGKILNEVAGLFQELDFYKTIPDFATNYDRVVKQIGQIGLTKQTMTQLRDGVVTLVQEVHLDYPEKSMEIKKIPTPPPVVEDLVKEELPPFFDAGSFKGKKNKKKNKDRNEGRKQKLNQEY